MLEWVSDTSALRGMMISKGKQLNLVQPKALAAWPTVNRMADVSDILT